MSLISNNPAWYVLFCVVAGLLLAGILYYKSKKDGFDKRKLLLMAGLRFVSVFLISFLLLAFLLKIERRRSENPIVVLLHDNSESLSDFLKKNPQWSSEWTDFSGNLDDKFQIERMTFGKEISTSDNISSDEKQTDIANALTQLRTQFYGRNLAAVVLASDGIYTAGEHPASSAGNLKVPVFTVALGDTTEYKDIKIHRVNHNKYAYLGNQFPLNIEVRATQCAGATAVLSVQTEGKTVFTKNISIDKPSFFETVECFEQAVNTGIQRYVISISTLQGERNTTNNRSEIFVEVLDNRRKILLLGAAPHPDISAIKQSVLESERYEVDLVLDGNLPSALEKYDVAILHQLPAKTGVMNVLAQQVSEKKLPVWVIAGTQTEWNAFNKMEFGVHVQLQGQQANEAFPSFNSVFTHFGFSDESQNQLYNFPPLNVPFATFTTAEFAQAFLFQKILNVATDMPLMLVGQNLNNRSAVLLGEGIWRWRLNEYLQKQNHQTVDELINKTIQYLSASADKRLFRVNTKNIFDETEPIEMDAELYNETYEPVTSSEVSIEIKNENGDVYPFTFSVFGDTYKLRAGLLPVGDYSYIAKTKLGTQNHQVSGRFSVRAMNVEQLNLRADHQLLNLIAKQSDAEMVYPNQLEELSEMLVLRDDAKPVTYVEKGFYELIRLKWILLFLILILSLEYFLRRFYGSY